MYIERNGQKIELTQREIEIAYRTQEKEYDMEDIRLMVEELQTRETSLKEVFDELYAHPEILVETYRNNLNKCDPYYDAMWRVLQTTIEDYIEKRKNQ